MNRSYKIFVNQAQKRNNSSANPNEIDDYGGIVFFLYHLPEPELRQELF